MPSCAYVECNTRYDLGAKHQKFCTPTCRMAHFKRKILIRHKDNERKAILEILEDGAKHSTLWPVLLDLIQDRMGQP